MFTCQNKMVNHGKTKRGQYQVQISRYFKVTFQCLVQLMETISGYWILREKGKQSRLRPTVAKEDRCFTFTEGINNMYLNSLTILIHSISVLSKKLKFKKTMSSIISPILRIFNT